ncbi:CHAT domain-containing protein [Actinophytocola oryzae]|uniref:CHAT domain-containing protein n=1 Tax=Actinophytocola oryzae TaxID=502181 RepID=A0A4R7UZK9_9PSEU|nr:CHAT domain-containing protein [Actinophytocola oryzae]TDV40985.1 CHAT domain-containing protein [Actinophytocola oryzae]
MVDDRPARVRRAREAGDVDAAILVARSGLVRAAREDDLPSMVVLARELDGLADSLGAEVLDAGERRRPWEDLRQAARRLESPAMEVLACLELARKYLAESDDDLAARHIETVLDLAEKAPADPLFDRAELSTADATVMDVLDRLYYRHRNFEAVATVAAKVAERVPDLPLPWFYLAHSLNRLDRYQEAVDAFGRLNDLAPDQPGPLIAASRALAALGRTDEAAVAASGAIDLKPDDVQYRFIRAQIHQAAGDTEAALADLTHVVAEAAEPDDLADYARVTRVQILREHGRFTEATDDAWHMARTGDLATRAAGHLLLGEILQETGHHEEAVTHFGAHLDLLAMNPVDARLRRAESRVALGRLDEAVADLNALVGQGDHHDAEAAATALTPLAERHPPARKALGRALLEDFLPGRAVEVLAHEDTEDWQVRAWLGMAMVTSSRTETEWNEKFDHDRVVDAVGHLVAAARLAPAQDYPRTRLRWLVERALVLQPVAHTLTTGADLGVTDVLPELAGVFGNWREAARAEAARRFSDAVAALTAARATAAEAGLAVLTALLDVRLADNYLRLYDMQRVFDHIASAEGATAEIGMLPGMTREHVDAMLARTRDAGGRAALQDIDHLELSSAVLATFLAGLDVLRAQAAHRLGDAEAALRLLPDDAPGNQFEITHFRMMALRDAGRVDEAMDLLKELRDLAEPEDLVKVANIEASLHIGRDEFTRAAEVLETELAAREHDPAVAAGLVSNLLGAYLGLERAEDVLDLDREHPVPDDVPPRFGYARLVTVARALGMLGRHDEELRTFLDAIELIDRMRGTLHDEQARMTWQGTHVHVYEEAVSAALAVGRPATALDLVERSKARAFVDQLGLGPAEPSERLQKTRKSLEDARRRLALLHEIAAAPDPSAEVDLVHRVNELRPVGSVDVADLDGELARERAAVDRLSTALALEPLKGKSSVAAATLSTVEIYAQLDERAVLAEYFVGVDETVLFLMTPADPIPVVHGIPHGARDIAEFVDRHLGTARAMDRDAFEDDFHPFVAPITDRCARGDTVVLVPHGLLHHVPLHSLLLDRNPVCHLPSASLLRYRRKDTEDRGWRTAVVFGDSRGDLVHARSEAEAIAGVFGAEAALGDDASRARLADGLAARPDVVHLACHGRFDGRRPTDSAVLLAPADTRPDAELSAADVFGLDLRVNLVTLSACESGVSANRPGDELIGLTRAALHAGAPALVVSLWEVDDLSTELLMTAFYRQLRDGVAPAEALRQAQLGLADTTAGDVVAHCDAALERSPDAVTTAAVLLARAGAQAVAGDVTEAIATCRQIALDRARGVVADRLRARVERLLILLSLKEEVETVVDYEARPYAHPHHWAAFVLVGDWR